MRLCLDLSFTSLHYTLQTSACLLLTIQYITNINIDGMVPQGPSHLRVYEEKSGDIDNTKNCIWSSLMPNQAVSGRTGEDTWVVPLLVPDESEQWKASFQALY